MEQFFTDNINGLYKREMEDKSQYHEDHSGSKSGTSAKCRDHYLDLCI